MMIFLSQLHTSKFSMTSFYDEFFFAGLYAQLRKTCQRLKVQILIVCMDQQGKLDK